jgi:hypothetical protein
MDVGRLYVKKVHALNPAFRQWAQSLVRPARQCLPPNLPRVWDPRFLSRAASAMQMTLNPKSITLNPKPLGVRRALVHG